MRGMQYIMQREHLGKGNDEKMGKFLSEKIF